MNKIAERNKESNLLVTATVFALCSIHAFRNCKGTSKHYSLATKLAKSSTEDEYKKNLEDLSLNTNAKLAEDMNARADDFSYLRLSKLYNLQTNFGK